MLCTPGGGFLYVRSCCMLLMLLLPSLSAVSDMAVAHVVAFALLSCWLVLLLWLLPPLPAAATVAVA